MLGPIGAHLMSVLRVMTPSEIDRYSQASERRKTTAVAAGAEDMDLDSSQLNGRQSHSGGFKKMTEAQIIPIRPEREEPERNENKAPPETLADETSSSERQLEEVGIFSQAKVEEVRKRAHDLARASEDSSSVFLLKQREKLKKSNNRMVGNAALKTYAQTAHAEMTQAEVDLESPDEELAQGSKGILINKKHF